MPLSELQVASLRLLASHRNPESYVAGATALNRDGPRFSDIDVFHDREESVAQAAGENRIPHEDSPILNNKMIFIKNPKLTIEYAWILSERKVVRQAHEY